jgi:LDH2 family malate/lactate/ureidoglycolate dehydrogenase
VTGPPLRVPAEDHRALCTHDLTGLTRTALGDDVRRTIDPTDPPTKRDVFIAMDPGAPGHDRVREPGARACATRAANVADAVPVSQVTWTSAQHIAADVPEGHWHA